ncbi:hypothetical protein GCM10009853_079560 [Glycomyces scopariae]|uniref:Uncharacterized protein n=1 Tax=Glycomyces sambucus TaxID=380244 RepID=A0A1G9EUH9_9ACTN|nr:hypothetical protein [Glycomyces sambucus]SDK79770.1 hypothetical protein SAMN05216298_1405 [Glycomyces sambucus]
MNGPDNPLPSGYPDPEAVGWLRTDEIEFLELHIRMTITPGERIVQLWQLADGHPVSWIGNVFRIDSEPPGLYLNHKFETTLNRPQRDSLARLAAKFWKS